MFAFRIAPDRKSGFTLVECLVTLLLLWVVLAIITPPMRDVFMSTRLSMHVNDWLAANRLARSEAIRRGKLVTICRSASPDLGRNDCDTAAIGDRAANDWGTGYLVFVENSPSGLGVVNPGDEILFRQGAFPQKIVGPSTLKKISYNATGEPIGTIAGLNIRFNFDGKFERIVCMTRTGRSRVLPGRSSCD